MARCLVLIADDDPSFRTMLGLMLEDLGHTVIAAENGAQAFDLAKERQPHLIISDIQMPDMDGVELNTHLQLDPRTKGIPVLMLTGNEVKQMEVGINFASTMKFEYILSKNSTPDQVAAKILEILERYYQV